MLLWPVLSLAACPFKVAALCGGRQERVVLFERQTSAGYWAQLQKGWHALSVMAKLWSDCQGLLSDAARAIRQSWNELSQQSGQNLGL